MRRPINIELSDDEVEQIRAFVYRHGYKSVARFAREAILRLLNSDQPRPMLVEISDALEEVSDALARVHRALNEEVA